MAYVNVAEWNSDQVAEWLKGLDDILHPYIHSFVKNNVDGQRLLHLAPDDLPSLNITCIGHQEIILQGVELLSNIHFHIHKENLQDISLRLSSKARSIYNELRLLVLPTQDGVIREGDSGHELLNGHDEYHTKQKKERVPTRIVAGVADVLSSVKTLVSWLHRTPFHGQEQYDELKSKFVDISIGLATIAQRDTFAENPVSVVRECCLKLAEMADTIIQDSKDPLILQPASLDVFTIKKRADDDWGIVLFSSYHGVHQISAIRALSPAHTCGKLMGGDQVVQVNYQTVVGWMSYKVTQLMQENPTQVILTLKKCPRHVNTITEIYFKPIRLPSKKRTYSPWNTNALVPQRYDLQSIPNLQFVKSFDGRSAAQRAINTEPHPKSMTPSSGGSNSVNVTLNSSGSDVGTTTASEGDDEASDFEDDAFMSDDIEFGGSSSLSVRLFQPKPRPHVQRRATIPGATARHTLPFDHILQEYCQRQLLVSSIDDTVDQDLYIFRNKESGESRISRPHTCIGTEKKEVITTIPFSSIKDEGDMPFIDESDEKEEVDNFCPTITLTSSINSPKISLKNEKIVDCATMPGSPPKNTITGLKKRSMTPPKSPIEAIDELKIFRRTSEERPKLDKSYSSPTYDLDDDEVSSFLQRKNELILPVRLDQEKQLVSMEVPALLNISENCIKEESNEADSTVNHFNTKYFQSSVLMPYSINHESFLKDALPNISENDSQNNHSTLAIPTFENVAPVPSTSIHLGGNCGSLVSVINRDNAERQSLNASKSSNSHLSSKYMDMNKAAVNEILSQLPHNSSIYATHDYINYGNGGGGRQYANNSDYGDSLIVRSNTTLNPHLKQVDRFCNSIVQRVDSLSSNVTLREGKSDSPSTWRRGLISQGSSGNRRISCRDLGQGDHHGWLYRRKESKGFLLSPRWEKRWFILKKSNLYGYRDKEAMKADSLIYLPGFHVCPAPDVKSKRFAFKIYHSSGATFYFACDTGEERSRWMSQMGLSAISSSVILHKEDAGKSGEFVLSKLGILRNFYKLVSIGKSICVSKDYSG